MAGPPSAGKPSTHERLFNNHWRELDFDVFKGYLLEAALTDGSLQEMPGEQSYFYPDELSALVHRESTELFAVAAREAIGRGESLVIDGTMAWKPWSEELVARLMAADIPDGKWMPWEYATDGRFNWMTPRVAGGGTMSVVYRGKQHRHTPDQGRGLVRMSRSARTPSSSR